MWIGVPHTSLIENLFDVLGETINAHLAALPLTLCFRGVPLRDLDSLPTDGHIPTVVTIRGGIRGGNLALVGVGVGGQHCPSPNARMAAGPWSWRVLREDILFFSFRLRGGGKCNILFRL